MAKEKLVSEQQLARFSLILTAIMTTAMATAMATAMVEAEALSLGMQFFF
jgi:hypothetical protein